MNIDLISAISAIAQVFIGIGTFVLSYVIWRSTDRKAKLDFLQLIQNDCNEYNTLILSFPNLAKISDEILANEEYIVQEDKERLKRYLQYKMLNILESEYYGQQEGLIYDEYHSSIHENILSSILKNGEMIKIIKTSGYNEKFVDYCEGIYQKIKSGEKVKKRNGLTVQA